LALSAGLSLVSTETAYQLGRRARILLARNVTAALTVDPPPSDISCPGGQTLQLALVSYTDVVLTDRTNGISVDLGDFNSGCLLPNVRDAC
jgi:hypothetical protein